MIREYDHRDFEDVLYLQHLCYLKPCTREELRERLRVAWVACVPEVIGCVICSDVYIWSLTVAPPYQRQGIGNLLMEEAEKHLGPEIKLTVDSANPAKRLYDRRGYVTSQILKDHYGKGYDAVEMVKRPPRKT